MDLLFRANTNEHKCNYKRVQFAKKIDLLKYQKANI